MKSSLFVSAALAAALAAAPSAAFAWGPLGHRLVADLAEAQSLAELWALVEERQAS